MIPRFPRSIVVLLLFAAGVGGAAPRIVSISPTQGPIAGGTVVTVSGSGFSGATVVLDERPISPSSISDSQIRLTMPAHDNGYAVIQVLLSGQGAAAEFLYVPPRLADLPPGYITTIAGVGDNLRIHLPATTANIRAVGIAVDSQGNILFAWPNADRILQVRKDGTLEAFAGSGLYPDEMDNGDSGPAVAAGISFCRAVSLDAAGNAYIPDEQHRIRRVDATTGIISTIAGTGVAGFSGDGGAGKLAQIRQPNFLAADADGTLYFGDHGNARIRKISTAGVISTIAGTGVVGDTGDGGPATEARLDWPQPGADADEIALDRTRQLLYVAEYFAGRVRRIDLRSGIITAFYAGDPPAFPLVHPWGLLVDSASNVTIGSEGQIVKLDPGGRVLRRWGTGNGFSVDGTPLDAILIGNPPGLAVEADGNLLFSDQLWVRRMNFATGKLETVAGIAPRAFGVPGPGIGAVLIGPDGDLAFLPSGDLLFGDTGSLRIFRIDPAGQITEFGGTGTGWSPEPGGDGEPISRTPISPIALAADAYGGLYTSDTAEIDYIDPEGIFHRVTQGWTIGYGGDGGPARDALLLQPFDVTLDRDGNVFIADSNNNRIRRIDRRTGIITTVAGSGPPNGFDMFGHGSFCGDGGPALDACFNSPLALAVDPDGNIFVQDFYNHRIRKVDARGIVSTFAADRVGGKIVADAYGGLFVSAMQVIHRYLPDGTSWAVAGTYLRGFSGDGGPAREAKITAESLTAGLAVDREGNLFFHDVKNRRIRAVRFGAVLAPPSPLLSATLVAPSTAVGSPFPAPLDVTVKASWGTLAPGVRVDFTAPSSGPSCVFSNHQRTISVLTGRDGKASAACTATCRPGSYAVTATPLGSGRTVSFTLTNTPPAPGTQPTLLCLDDRPGDDRFQVDVGYHTTQSGGLQGKGKSISLSSLGVSRGGLFWFFSGDNPELLVKVLNGCEVNSRYWVFSSAGTNVGLDVTVTDTFTGNQKLYTNPDRTAAAPIQDIDALPCGTSAVREASSILVSRPEVSRSPGTHLQDTSLVAPACATDETTLCIDSRYRVTMDYQTVQGGGLSGRAHAIPLNSLGLSSGGLFWFISPDNPEMLVKIVDGCGANGKHWLFYAAGTNLGLSVTVTDTRSGETKTYTNPDLMAAIPVQDIDAFGCP